MIGSSLQDHNQEHPRVRRRIWIVLLFLFCGWYGIRNVKMTNHMLSQLDSSGVVASAAMFLPTLLDNSTESFWSSTISQNGEGQSSLPVANSTSPNINSTSKDSMSACLLVMDDNHRLAEWLTYHYHVLPLRHLVIANDIHSRSTPTELLRLVQQDLPDLQIVQWNDSHFANFQPHGSSAPIVKLRHQYLVRQRQFLKACLEYYHNMGDQEWVACFDTGKCGG